jgi:asparagine synthetase B (glutamine-hydrolysing)
MAEPVLQLGATPALVSADRGLCVRNFIRTTDGSERLELGSCIENLAPLRDAMGQFALHQTTADSTHLLARDLLGVNKLFYAIGRDGTPICSNFWFELIRAGFSPDAVWSLPSGHMAVFEPAKRTPQLQRYASLEFGEDKEFCELNLERHVRYIQRRLNEVFQAIRDWSTNQRIYVSLSGGLDSTGIALLAREILGRFTAVTFAVADSTDGSSTSEDLLIAERVAGELGVQLKTVLVSREQVLESLDLALLYGQDWREFNVHCALVNVAVGRAISEDHGAFHSTPPLLLTGDVMNELMADYAPVMYKGKQFYSLPQLSAGHLRRVLVAGLDSGDREIGIMRSFGIDAIQPYALCAATYAVLPGSWLSKPRSKQALAQAIFGKRVPAYVYARPKTRAQEGSSGTGLGTLRVCVDEGIDADWLKRRFGELFGIDPSSLQRFIRGGFYRFDAARKK